MARYQRGETPKLSKEIIETLASAIRQGTPVEKAVLACGISKDTLYRWLHSRAGRYSTPLIVEFQTTISAAMEYARLRNLGLIKPPPDSSL